MATIRSGLLTDMATSAGLAIFSVDFENTSRGSDLLCVEVIGSGQPTAQFQYNGESKKIGVHTHRLKPGKHTVEFQLVRDGKLLDSSKSTFQVEAGSGVHDAVGNAMEAHATPLVFEGACDSTYYPYADKSLTAWFDRPDYEDHIQKLLNAGDVTSAEADHLRHFAENGFLVVPELIDETLVAKVNAEIDDAIKKGYGGYEYGTSQRLEHLHNEYPNMRKLWLDKRHRRFADLIFGVQSRPCQTLTYVFGSQQDDHSDLIHLTPFPAGLMCGTWIALQDVVEGSGELVVYKGSHRSKRLYMSETGCAKVNGDWTEFGKKVIPLWAEATTPYERFVYRPQKGTVLIWHENLMHGGSVRLNAALERRSVVIHSFADGALVYYDSTGSQGFTAARATLEEVVG